MLPLLFSLKIEAQTSMAVDEVKRIPSTELSHDKDGEGKSCPLPS